MDITNLKLTVDPSERNDHRQRRRFKCVFDADGVHIKGSILLLSDDGSIKSNIGKWYPRFEAGKYLFLPDRRHRFGSGHCPRCSDDLASALMKSVRPLLKAKGFALATGGLRKDHGWSLFSHNIPNTGEYETVATRRAGPECVQIFMEAPALCPVHGKVKTEDTDVAD